jgi:stearoyl-CoA desaturase (delta-9 desaturase)
MFRLRSKAARHGLTWYELDINWYGISALRMLCLAWDVKVQRLNPDEARTTAVPQRLAV